MKEVVIKIEELKMMNQFIVEGHTGGPLSFASKMCYSERKFYEALAVLRAYIKPFGVDCIYVESLDTYVYTSPGQFFIDIGFKHYQADPPLTAI
jgi:hypothetical protein